MTGEEAAALAAAGARAVEDAWDAFEAGLWREDVAAARALAERNGTAVSRELRAALDARLEAAGVDVAQDNAAA